MDNQQHTSIRPGDVIDVRSGPAGTSRRGVVLRVRSDDEPRCYEVAWADGTATRLYVSDRLVTVVGSTDPYEESRAGTDHGARP